MPFKLTDKNLLSTKTHRKENDTILIDVKLYLIRRNCVSPIFKKILLSVKVVLKTTKDSYIYSMSSLENKENKENKFLAK